MSSRLFRCLTLDMAAIVMVHGAWGGSYGFRHVRKLLNEADHDVFTPSLTGIGERSHLTGPHVNLELHITDVRNMIFCEDLHDIVLLGFSYGGMVVTGLLDFMTQRIRHLVYLDAFVPNDGESAAKLVGQTTESLTSTAIDGLVPPVPRQLDTPEDTLWSNERRVGQPVATLTDPVRLSTPLEEHAFTRTYIKASADPGESPESGFWRAARRAQESDRWSYHEIETHHMVPLSRPQELAKILIGIAER